MLFSTERIHTPGAAGRRQSMAPKGSVYCLHWFPYRFLVLRAECHPCGLSLTEGMTLLVFDVKIKELNTGQNLANMPDM